MAELSMFSLDGKKAIVTGGAQGIGREIALGLANAGADMAIVDMNLDGAEKVTAEIRGLGRKAIAVKADVSISKNVHSMTQTVIKEFGRIDILVNNAGVNKQVPAEELDEATWNRVIGVNLTGVFLCSQAVGRQMIKQGSGNIINISSFCSQVNTKGSYQASYNSSKAGVAMLTKTLAAEWVKHNIRVNAIAPGFTATPMFQKDREKLKDSDVLLALVPMARFQNPKDLVGVVIFLASKASSYVTGHELVSDGGVTLW